MTIRRLLIAHQSELELANVIYPKINLGAEFGRNESQRERET
jgi:hypothetical protein